jgi:hypothetical protein
MNIEMWNTFMHYFRLYNDDERYKLLHKYRNIYINEIKYKPDYYIDNNIDIYSSLDEYIFNYFLDKDILVSDWIYENYINNNIKYDFFIISKLIKYNKLEFIEYIKNKYDICLYNKNYILLCCEYNRFEIFKYLLKYNKYICEKEIIYNEKYNNNFKNYLLKNINE